MTDLPDMEDLNLKKDVKRSHKYKLLKNFIFGEKDIPNGPQSNVSPSKHSDAHEVSDLISQRSHIQI